METVEYIGWVSVAVGAAENRVSLGCRSLRDRGGDPPKPRDDTDICDCDGPQEDEGLGIEFIVGDAKNIEEFKGSEEGEAYDLRSAGC